MNDLSVLVGLLALIVFCFWFGREMAQKPKTKVNLWIFENVTTVDFSIIFDIVGVILLIPLLAFLQIQTQATAYASIFDKLFVGGAIFIGLAVVGYLVFYLIYRFNENIETIASHADTSRGKGRYGK